MPTETSQIPQCQLDSAGRAEIDTSAPFESVKEATSHFGGMGFWKPKSSDENASEHDGEIVGIAQEVEEQAVQLERDLIMKESETLDVLKELEEIKQTVEELKLKLQKEASEINETLEENLHDNKENFVSAVGNNEGDKTFHPNGIGGSELPHVVAPGSILLELKQAKLNLTKTTNDLSDIRAIVDLYSKKIEKERVALERTHRRLSSNASKFSCLERQNRGLLNESEVQNSQGSTEITRELHKLSFETEQFMKVGEAANSQVLRAISEIKQTKAGIRTAEIRLVAAQKMKEAAKASEAVALAEIKALSKSQSKGAPSQRNQDNVTLTFEEYSSLISKAREAENACEDRAVAPVLQADEENVSKTEILKKVEEATEEVKSSKKALEEALHRVEAASRGKSAVEEALRVWSSEHDHRRRSSCNFSKFKNHPHPSTYQKEAHLLPASGLNLASDELKPVLKPTLSIGQILSRKLLLTEEFESRMQTEKLRAKHKVSLGHVICKHGADLQSAEKFGKENNKVLAKRTKFGLARISLLVAKQSKKKKNVTATPMHGST